MKTINFYPKGSDKEIKPLVKLEQLSMGLKKIRKTFIDNFTEISKKENSNILKYKLLFRLDNLEVNFYKPKTEVQEKNGKIFINIAYPINEEFLVKLIKSKIKFFYRNDNDSIGEREMEENKDDNYL